MMLGNLSVNMFFAEDENDEIIIISAKDIYEAEDKLRSEGYTTCLIHEVFKIIK